MDKNEVITLSSDDETETKDRAKERQKNISSTVIIKSGREKPLNIAGTCSIKSSGNIAQKKTYESCESKGKDIKMVKNLEAPEKQWKSSVKVSPEVVDLVDFLDNLDEDQPSRSDQGHLDLDIIDIDETLKKNDSTKKVKTHETKATELCSSLILKKPKINQEYVSDLTNNTTNLYDNISGTKFSQICQNSVVEESNQNLKFFTEFVEYCGSLESIENDRVRLTKKLMKRYGEADCKYIKSEEFRYLVQKCREKINKNNLYLIAKEITEELVYRKKITICKSKSKLKEGEINQRDMPDTSEDVYQHSKKLTKKQIRFINKIIKKLDKLGSKIRELEEQEVDLSDEEDSSYVLLQRYRERFCQIYKKLCAYTDEIPDPTNSKICFTESKYPAINKCIGNWLNKTKRFPDFADITKLIESQSSSLGLPSNKESVRAIAIEVFQKVGAMLQRRRIYDLWDTFCGFLDVGKDPADSDPILDQLLKNNFETRLKKEQEIFQRYAELQEKEKLEPEEVADEDANNSPVESENEDYKEIEDIENCLNKRIDDAIKETESNGNTLETKQSHSDGNDSENEAEFQKLENTIKSKETKNNYKNCKSLKWRQENGYKARDSSSNLEDSSAGENEKEKLKNGFNITKVDGSVKKEKCKETNTEEKDDSDLELIAVENVRPHSVASINEVKMDVERRSPYKRVSSTKMESPALKIIKCESLVEKKANDFDVFEIDDENENLPGGKSNEIFGVHCCQIFPDSVFQDMNEEKKGWKKRKVFRDLTNVNRLMQLHGKRRKMSGLFSPFFFHGSFYEFEKSYWKKRFKVSFRLVTWKDQKCALSQNNINEKNLNLDFGGDSDEKEILSNSEGGGDDEGDNFFGSHGNVSEEDTNEDENKNRQTYDRVNKQCVKIECEEDEENHNKKSDSTADNQRSTFFFSNQKTEELSHKKYNSEQSREKMQPYFAGPEFPISSSNLENIETDKEQKELKEICEIPEKKNEVLKDNIETKEVFEGAHEVKEEENNEEKNNTETEVRYNVIHDEGDEDNSKMEARGSDERGNILVDELKTGTNETEEDCKNNEEVFYEHQNDNFLYQDTETESHIINLESEKFNYVENLEFKASLQINNKKQRRVKSDTITDRNRKYLQLEPMSKLTKRTTFSTSDEERINRFLVHSSSSISITPPKKLPLLKPPSQAALKALATLRNLKGITATVIRSKPKNDDDVVVIESSCIRRSTQNYIPAKRRRNGLPVIGSVQSMACTTRIVTDQENVPKFESPVTNIRDSDCESTSIRISSVWGNSVSDIMQIPKIDSVSSGCNSPRQIKPNEKTEGKNNSKKTVEYVILE